MRERTQAEIEAAVTCFRDKGIWLQKHTVAEAFAAADAVAPPDARIGALEAEIDWVTFDPRGPLPPERKYVLIQFSKISCYGIGPVAVGYLRYAAGDRDSPFFVVPGVKRTNDYHEPDVPREEMIVTHWADIFGDDFECPGWHGTRILTTAKS